MKNLLKIAMIVIILITAGTTFQSCKKGPEDPTISLKSRKARLAGEYNVTAMNTTGEGRFYTKVGNCEETNTYKLTGMYQNSMHITTQDVTTQTKGCWGSNDTTFTSVVKDTSHITLNVMFDKDGNYKWVTTELLDPTNPIITQVTTREGTWNFAAGVGEVKSKEQIILNETKVTRATTNSAGSTTTTVEESKNSTAEIISLKQLRSDEVIMVTTEEYKSPNGNNTYKHTTEIILTEK